MGLALRRLCRRPSIGVGLLTGRGPIAESQMPEDRVSPQAPIRQLRTLLGPTAFLAALGGLFALFQCSGPADATSGPTPPSGNGWLSVYFTRPVTTTAESYRGGPDEAIVASLDMAESTIDVAAYALDLWSIRDALLRAHRRGVAVRLVVESDNLLEPEVEALAEAGIPVVGDRREPLMHHKFAVIDTLEIWTGSMNLTLGSTYFDDNNLVRIRSAEVAEDYMREFEEMFTEDRFGPLSLADTPYPTVLVEGYRVEVLFSPDDDVADRIHELIVAADQSIEVMGYAFTSDALAEALIARAQQGVEVRVVLDAGQVTAAGSEYGRLLEADIDVRLDGSPGNMHHKVMIFDRSIVLTGSYNFTRSAEEYNDEAVVIVHDSALASEFHEEFERIYVAGTP